MPSHPLGNIVGQRLRQVREARGLTQKDLAQRLGANERSVSRWETGATEIGLHDIVLACRALDVSADFVLGMVDEEALHRVRPQTITFIDWRAVQQLRDSSHVSDVADLFDAGFRWRRVVEPHLALVSSEQAEQLEKEVEGHVSRLRGFTAKWVTKQLEERSNHGA